MTSNTSNYNYEATSLTGFVQQLAANYLPHGYWFFVQGRVKAGKDPQQVDAKLLRKYGIAVSRQSRARRKQRGEANLHYLRYGADWVMVATHGRHRWFLEHMSRDRRTGQLRPQFQDARKVPIKIGGYSITVKPGNYRPYRVKQRPDGPPERDTRYRVRVQIARGPYRELKALFVELATRRSSDHLSAMLYNVPFEPYAPVRQQLFGILRRVNRARKAGGYRPIPSTAIRTKRRIVKPFAVSGGRGGPSSAGLPWKDRVRAADQGESPSSSPERFHQSASSRR